MTTAVATIIAKRELAAARVLMRGVAEAHPGWKQYVLLADEVEGRFDPAREAFTVLPLRHFPLPDKQATLFHYDATELRAAAKPHLVAWLFETLGFDDVVYLDPGVWVHAPLERVERALEDGVALALAPHLVGGLDDLDHPAERETLIAGVFDGAMLALSRHAKEANELLLWWRKRAYREFVIDPASGPSGDQRWLDLAAGRWPVTVIRDPEYNVTRETLDGRALTRSGKRFLVDGRPLRYCRVDSAAHAERRAPRGSTGAAAQSDAAAELVEAYDAALRAAGHEQCRGWPYAFDRFANGAPISPLCRRIYRTEPAARDAAGDDPFETGPGPFNAPHRGSPFVTRVMAEIWRERPDLQRTFPDPSSPGDGRRFAQWFVTTAGRECGVPEPYLAPVREALLRSEEATAGRPAEPVEPQVEWSGPAPARRRGRLRRGVRAVLSLGGSVARAGLSRLLDAGIVPGRLAAEESPERLAEPATPEEGPRRHAGLNIVGYVTADLGLGQSARSAAAAADAVGLPHSAIDFSMGTMSPKTDRTLARRIAVENTHPVNLVHLNAEQMPYFRRAMGRAFFEGKYTIGYWHWELPVLPDDYVSGFEGLDEVWVPTRFVQTAVSEKARVPVVLMPHCVSFEVGVPSRARFGLPAHRFLFLTMYDLFSFQERKNPSATIAAFRAAFGSRSDVGLVVKVINADRRPEDLARLKDAVADLKGVVLIQETLSRQGVYDLEAACDAFVSLHRAEGFGLGLAEAMYLGKPVIGTNWSGNTDFMNRANSCPVDYELVPLERDYGPYRKGQIWADADVDHAASCMRQLVEDRAYAERIGARARATIRAENSPEAIGARYRARLRVIGFE